MADYFTTLQWVLSYIDMNQPWSYMSSPSRSPLPPPSPPDSSGSSQARALVPCIPHGLVICFTIDNTHAIKSSNTTLLTEVYIVKATVFPVVMYGCESWTIKKAEHWRIDAFKLWCWRRLLRVLWTVRRSDQLILKEISSDHSFEGLMLKLKPWYFGYLIRRADSLGKTLTLEKTEGRRRRG